MLCVDAIHFAPRPEAAYGEIARILSPGGRAVLTNWEPLTRDDPALRSFHDEGVRALHVFDLVRRVLATATAP